MRLALLDHDLRRVDVERVRCAIFARQQAAKNAAVHTLQTQQAAAFLPAHAPQPIARGVAARHFLELKKRVPSIAHGSLQTSLELILPTHPRQSFQKLVEIFYDNEFRVHPIAATSIGLHDCDAEVDDSKRARSGGITFT
jgi:hypothetical protein